MTTRYGDHAAHARALTEETDRAGGNPYYIKAQEMIRKHDMKNRPICPECGKQTIVLFTPPKDQIVGTELGYETMGTPAYIDWYKAHLYCCNGETNCKYKAMIMGDDNLTT